MHRALLLYLYAYPAFLATLRLLRRRWQCWQSVEIAPYRAKLIIAHSAKLNKRHPAAPPPADVGDEHILVPAT